jgi:dihydroxyacetone kinase
MGVQSVSSSLRLRLPLILLSAKHFLNNPASLVVESLQGLCAINPKLGLDTTNKGSPICTTCWRTKLIFFLVVFLADQDKSTVALICGGGSGHEPSHAGFVGENRTWMCCHHEIQIPGF